MKKIALTIFFISLFILVNSQDKSTLKKNWEPMTQSKGLQLKLFKEAKFGMFIHFGAYSSLGGEWKGNQIEGLGEWIMYRARIPREDYKNVCSSFNPKDFNAEEWVKLAKDAGMKYIVAMAKHHEGFAMYHSSVTNFNIYDFTNFKRDPIEEIYKACQKYNIRLGLYYSHSIDWMDGGDAGNAQYQKDHPENTEFHASNTWDPSPITYDDYITNKAKPQMLEILTKFPNLFELWYDYPVNMNTQQSFDFYKLAFDLQPACLINSRVGNDFGDFLSADDNEIPTTIDHKYDAWETAGTMNDTWGYKKNDNNWKSTKEMLFWLVEIASKGGNYLLNVGPDGNGKIPEQSATILREIGSWMTINGEAIYGTNKWTTRKEGPTNIAMKGTEERAKSKFYFTFTKEDFWFTVKDNFIYAISLSSHSNESVYIKSLFKCYKQIKTIKALGIDEPLKWNIKGDKVQINFPEKCNIQKNGYVLKIELIEK